MTESEKPKPAEKMQFSRTQVQKVQNLSVSEKMELAKTANREVRAILLGDDNKQVQKAVLDSLRITESEIITVAESRNLGDDVLGKIATNLQWLKNYQVRVALVNNPKTPLFIALKLVPTLRDGDLKHLLKNKEVPEELVVAAERVTAERASGHRAPRAQQADKGDGKSKSRFQEISDLPVPDKIKLAMTGDKEARTILLRDSNKQVQEAVLNSPRITEVEIAAVANSRNVGDEILRKIASSREWMKNYQVRLGLVNNPKTPLPIGLKIVGTMMISDLKRLSKNKGVSNVVCSAAQRILIKKGVQ